MAGLLIAGLGLLLIVMAYFGPAAWGTAWKELVKP